MNVSYPTPTGYTHFEGKAENYTEWITKIGVHLKILKHQHNVQDYTLDFEVSMAALIN